MKSRVAFTICDQSNMAYLPAFLNSLRKFHSEAELPLIVIGPEQIAKYQDPHFFYRATPRVAAELMKEYETAIKFDVDQIVLGDLAHTWQGTFDAAFVQNSNPKELKQLRVSVWDIDPMAYLNCGLVVMKSKEFVDHWLGLCMSPHFTNYQYREQDLMNILVFYGNYDVVFLDASPMWHGLAVKGYEPQVELRGKDLVLPKNDTWPNDEDKKIVLYHYAGGNHNPDKGNYRIRFQPKVVKYIDSLVK